MTIFNLSKNLSPRLISKTRCTAKRFSTAVSTDEEYTGTPQYPPILDLSAPKRLERKKAAVHEEIKAVPTIEEKQIKLNMPRFYGFKSYLVPEDHIHYDSLGLVQHITRTHIVKSNNLPEFYKSVEADEITKELKQEVEDALLLEVDGVQRSHDFKNEDLSRSNRENIISASVSRQIHRIIINRLSKLSNHLAEAQVDLDPRIETCWYAGGMNPPNHVKRCRKGLEHTKEYENEPTDRLMYYIGSPNLTVRSDLPLRPLVPHSESENPDLDVPFYQYDPRVLGYHTEHRHMTNVPGFWPGDPQSFGLLSIHKRGHILDHLEHYKDQEYKKEALQHQAVLSSYAWLHAQANFLGFTTFNDITYPLVTQTVITNGQTWSFFAYQLNTILLHSKNVNENPKKNICWASDEMNLFEEVKDEKLIGFNEDVLKTLVKFYANQPEERLGVNLRPFLGQNEKVAADYEDDEKREWLEREYKFLVANRPRSREMDEIYSWEKIYKIDHKTRFMEKRLRPFELFIQPHKRRLDERRPKYIPRALRPDLPRWKGRYAKEFFP